MKSMGQLIVNIILGLFFIGLGFLVAKFPMLISGYNTLPKKEREKIDIRPHALFMRKTMVIMGLIIIAGALFFHLIGLKDWMFIVMLVTLIVGTGFMVLRGYKFLKNTNSKIQKWSFRIAVGIILLMIICLIDTGRAADIEVKDNTFIVQGAYGVKIPLDSITDVKITDQAVHTTSKSNGLGFWKYQKGYFQAKEYGGVLLFLHSGHGPYLVIHSTVKRPIIINRDTKEEIEAIYSTLKRED